MKILVYGDNASELMGGEATKPLRFFRGYRNRGHNCHLVTHERCKGELLKDFSSEELEHVTFIRDSYMQKIIHYIYKKTKIHVSPLIPLLTQIRARRLLLQGSLGNFDVIHQATPISPTAASALYGFECPVIIGPLASFPDYPIVFRQPGLSKSLRTNMKYTLSKIFNYIFPGKRYASIIFCDNGTTINEVNKFISPKIKTNIQLNNGVEEFWFEKIKKSAPKRPRFIYTGRLVEWKCVDMIIESAGCFGDDIELVIIGDGDLRKFLEQQAKKYENLSIKFVGWRNRQEIQAYYASATGVVTLALRESGGTSVQEAMASGTPLILTAWGGHLSRVEPDMGLLVEPDSRKNMVLQTAKHMKTLFEQPRFAKQLATAAQKHAYDNMRWAKKIEAFEKCIQQALALSRNR